MKKFKANSIILISLIALIFGCNVYFLTQLYQSIRADVEREVMSALADTDIDDMWERAERARRAAQVQGVVPMSLEEADSIYYSQHGSVSGMVDGDGNFETTAVSDDGDVVVQKTTLVRDQSYSNQMVKSMSQQMHEAMDKYYAYNLNITDSIFERRLADRQIFPEFVAIEIVDAYDNVLVGNLKLGGSTSGFDVFRLGFNPEKGWVFRACITPLTRHILSQMLGVIVTLLLLMIAFAAAFGYLFRTVSKLRTIEEMKDDFVSNMTHELKTPISIAYSANDALLNYDTSNDPAKKEAYLNIAIKQLRRLGELVENILAVSMERRKSMTIKIEKFDLQALVCEIAEAQRMRGEKPITIDVVSEGSRMVEADKSHLANVLNNLIDNSIKYSGESVHIDIKITNNGIEVADNGIGIPAKSLPFIFDKFYRVPHGNRQDVRGYGIGLYYVKHILEKMGWSITAQSKEGVGSTLTIKFFGDES